MWLTDQQFGRKREIHSRVGTREIANRLALMLNDDQGNFNNTRRYYLGRDSQSLEGVLLRYLPDQVCDGRQHTVSMLKPALSSIAVR
jgi:hypothetical protein